MNTERSLDSTRCTECGKTIPANIFPLLVVTGASGSGKTAIVPRLRGNLSDCVVFDKDLLWGRCGDWNQFYNNWLRIAYTIAQGGRFTLIAGIIMPWDFDTCEDRNLIGTIHYLNLHCSDDVREQRLRARPSWRQSTNDWFIEEHKRVARQLLEIGASVDPPMQIIDTTHLSVAKTAAAAVRWAKTVLKGYPKIAPSFSAATD